MELLLGCGTDKSKKVTFDGVPKEWSNELITLDWNEAVNPHVLHDLNMLPYPFDDDMFDEIHAYEVLEHCGTQGDFRFFFNQFAEIHRLLKPGGYFVGSCPAWDGVWAWSDPGHTRIISPESLIFLSQKEYEKQVGENAMTDYRYCYEADFDLISKMDAGNQWGFVLQAVK